MLAREAGRYVRALQWSMLPFLSYLVLRSYLAALERPRWGLVLGLLAIPVNLGAACVLMFGKFGLPAIGLVGAGVATTVSSTLHVRGARPRDQPRSANAALSPLRPLLARRLAALPQAVAPGVPIALTLAFEVTIFNAAALFMGLHRRGRARRARDRPPDRLLLFMVPLASPRR